MTADETAERTEVSPMLTVTAAAALLGVSFPTMYKWLRLGIVPSVRVGKTPRIIKADLIKWQADGCPGLDKVKTRRKKKKKVE